MPRESKKEALLQAALHCFATLGYDATRVKHIALAAGVSEGALYRHFPSTEAMAQVLFRRYMEEYVNTLQAAIRAEETVQGQLNAVVRTTLETYRSSPDAAAFILLGPPLFGTLPKDVPYPIALVTAIMRRGQERGELREGKPLLLAAIFLGCIVRPIIIARSSLHLDEPLLDSPADEDLIMEASWAAIAACA